MNRHLAALAVNLRFAVLGSALLLPMLAQAAIVRAVAYVGDHVFLTANAAEIEALDAGRIPGWTRSGLELWVHDAPGNGLVPVCRFFSAHYAPRSLHFLTAFASECEALKSSPVWVDEGIAFYAALPTSPPGLNAACAEGQVPIQRWYNDGHGGIPRHAFTPNREFGNANRLGGYGQIGWISEGLGYVPLGPVDPGDDFSEPFGQDGIAFCTLASPTGNPTLDFDRIAAGGLALAVGSRWTLQTVTRGAPTMAFADEIDLRSGVRQLRVTIADRSGTASWIGSNGQIGITIAPPTHDLGVPFYSLYLTYISRDELEGCWYEQRPPRLGLPLFEPCERVIATRR